LKLRGVRDPHRERLKPRRGKDRENERPRPPWNIMGQHRPCNRGPVTKE